MGNRTITERDRKLAQVCVTCLVCQRARRNQRGFLFWLVEKVESRVCPFCVAYEKVYGQKAHERNPDLPV